MRSSRRGLAALRQNRSKKTAASDDTTVPRTEKPKLVPPGLARASEKIGAKLFARADADGNGSVTQEELSAVHSKHAQTLAASDLFHSTPTEPASTDTDQAAEPPTTATGVTAEQLTEALKKYFYAKVGVIYETPTTPATEQPVEQPVGDVLSTVA